MVKTFLVKTKKDRKKFDKYVKAYNDNKEIRTKLDFLRKSLKHYNKKIEDSLESLRHLYKLKRTVHSSDSKSVMALDDDESLRYITSKSLNHRVKSLELEERQCNIVLTDYQDLRRNVMRDIAALEKKKRTNSTFIRKYKHSTKQGKA